MKKLKKLSLHDQVGVISPSSNFAAVVPWIYEAGITQLKESLKLVPITYPSTLKADATYIEKARDLHCAFADPQVKAVFSTTGGFDQLKLLQHLDLALIAANPKPFFGYSDNTQLAVTLWNLGIPSYYGGAIMGSLGIPGGPSEYTLNSLRDACFYHGERELHASEWFSEKEVSWIDKSSMSKTYEREIFDGWYFDGTADSEGALFGGCLEVLFARYASGLQLPDSNGLKGKILFLETSEIVPDHYFVEEFLLVLGERGILENFSGLLVGRPKTWFIGGRKLRGQERSDFLVGQREATTRIFRQYNRQAPIVFNLNLGHTHPQTTIPIGGNCKIELMNKRVTVSY